LIPNKISVLRRSPIIQVRSGFKLNFCIIQSNMGLLGLPNTASGSLPNAVIKGAAIAPPPGKIDPFAGNVESSLVNKKRHPGFERR
jgi:hypothetical protein